MARKRKVIYLDLSDSDSEREQNVVVSSGSDNSDSNEQSSSDPDSDLDGTGEKVNHHQNSSTETASDVPHARLVNRELKPEWKNDGRVRRHFFNGDPGVKARNLNDNRSPADVFSGFVTEELFDTISEKTNRFARRQRRRRRQRADGSHMKKWTNTTRSEIAGFLALVILMGVVVKPELGQYWSTDPYLHTPVFPTHHAQRQIQGDTEKSPLL